VSARLGTTLATLLHRFRPRSAPAPKPAISASASRVVATLNATTESLAGLTDSIAARPVKVVPLRPKAARDCTECQGSGKDRLGLLCGTCLTAGLV
jgi:hypothetical protein